MVLERWFALGLLGLIAFVLCAYALRTVVVGRKSDPRVASVGGSPLMGAWAMEAFYWAIRGASRGLMATHLSPDALTFLSLVFSLASFPLAAIGALPAAGLALILGSVFDAFDGIVARERNLSSDAGEVLDAVVDRYADAAPLLGLALFYRASLWQMTIPLVAALGSLMVSYVRAKAESMHVELSRTLMRRHERIAYLLVALFVGPAASQLLVVTWLIPSFVTLMIVSFIGLLTHYAAVRMTTELRAALVATGRGPRGLR